MLFQPEHIEQIRAGEKTETRRDWSENYNRPRVGSVQIAATEMFVSDDDADCYIRVLDVYRERLGDLDADSADAEGGYTVDEFRDVWTELHGDFDSDLEVDVVEFEYVGRERPDEDGGGGRDE